MNYEETLDWLFSQLPIYQRSGAAAYKADIGNIVEACERLNQPHTQFKSIHLAGTNGKGSCSHMLASVLQEAGYKVGLYTSPHLKDFRERIRINGQMIAKEAVTSFVQEHKHWFREIGMSFFEMTAALAFYHFAHEKVDVAVIETGLGGRLDSTNILQPELSIITNIGLDHTALLGDSLEKIAAEKAGIIKAHTPIVIGRKQKETSTVFEVKAEELQAPLSYASTHTYDCDLKGSYQKENINTVCSAVEKLNEKDWNISSEALKSGLLNVVRNTGLLGRWQILKKEPLTIADTGHNEDGIKAIIQQLQRTPHQELHFVFGAVNDKSIGKILSLLPKNAMYYFCEANIPRALPLADLLKAAKEAELKGEGYSSVKEALSNAAQQAVQDDLVFVGGSTFVVAEVL